MRQLRSGAAVFRTGPDGLIVEWNPEAEQLTGIAETEAEGRPCWDVIAGRDEQGGIVCHPGCSALRLAREAWPVRCLDVHARTPRGPSRLTLSTIVLQGDDDPVILHLMHETVDPVTPPADEDAGGELCLTPRQREILLLLAQGIRAKGIATRLTLSETTVRNHIQAILLALGVHSQLEAVARARALIPVDEESAA